MSRTSPKIALVALLPGLLLAIALTTVAAGKPTERSGVTTLLEPATMKLESADPAQPLPHPEPVTPFPMNLPDEVTPSEVEGQYAYGIAGLAFITVVLALVVGGIFHYFSFRSWRHSH